MVEIESQRNKTKFKGIDSQIEYTFVVSTLINGKTISKKVHTLKPTEEVNAKNDYSYVSIKNSYQIIVLLKGFSKINKNSVLNKSSESENELLI